MAKLKIAVPRSRARREEEPLIFVLPRGWLAVESVDLALTLLRRLATAESQAEEAPLEDGPRSCDQCQKPIGDLRVDARFCSSYCRRKWNRLRGVVVEVPQPTNCEHCRKPLEHKSRRHKRYCSVRCKKAASKARLTPPGDKTPRQRGPGADRRSAATRQLEQRLRSGLNERVRIFTAAERNAVAEEIFQARGRKPPAKAIDRPRPASEATTKRHGQEIF